jgi:hypothetical protein
MLERGERLLQFDSAGFLRDLIHGDPRFLGNLAFSASRILDERSMLLSATETRQVSAMLIGARDRFLERTAGARANRRRGRREKPSMVC